MKKVLCYWALAVTVGWWIGGLELVPQARASSIATLAYNLVENAGTPLTRRSTINCTGGLTCSDAGGLTVMNVAAGGAQQHSVSFVIDGGGTAILTGDLKSFPSSDYACTINRVDVSADQVGSITVDIWKAAGAIPTAANKISASAPATLASAQLSQAGSISGWTTGVSIGDVFGGTVASATTVQRVTVQIWCQ